MKIGIDGIPLGQLKTGVGHYTYEIAVGVARYSQSDVFQLLSHIPFDPAAIGNSQEHSKNLTFVVQSVNWLTKHWWTIGLPIHLRKHGFDLFHGTNYEVPIYSKCPTILTIHDLSLLLHSNTHETRRVRRARRRLPLMARLATLIIVPTFSVRQEVHTHLGISIEKIRVVPEAPRRSFYPLSKNECDTVKKQFGIEDQFILYVGTIEPRKNVITLVRALEEIYASSQLRPQLVLAGRRGWLTDEFFAYLEQSKVRNRILLTGYLHDSDLVALYSSCTVMVFPAIYEGAGLPPLEAMACGAPVITTDTPAISEMVGDGARLFSPLDHHELAQQISDLFNDSHARIRLAELGIARVSQFTWDKSARLTYDVYQEAWKFAKNCRHYQ